MKIWTNKIFRMLKKIRARRVFKNLIEFISLLVLYVQIELIANIITSFAKRTT